MDKKKTNAKIVFKYTDAVSNSNKSVKTNKSGNTLSLEKPESTTPKETYITPKSSTKENHIALDVLRPSTILQLNTNEQLNIDTKQMYVNYFVNKNWTNINNYLPFYEIELLDDDDESDYETEFYD
tara:strand:- start:1943 stop:2320 length:378 start_codon:yes stop_codon:yes gene_type:complete